MLRAVHRRQRRCHRTRRHRRRDHHRATTKGQEADPIIAYITDAVQVDDTNGEQFETMKELIRYYETYYEMYGRKVNLVTFEGTGNALDEVAARADAAQIAVEYKPFVVFGGPALTSAFADELAAHEVICIGCTPGQPESFYGDRDPYVWGLDGSPSQKQAARRRVHDQADHRQERRATAATR